MVFRHSDVGTGTVRGAAGERAELVAHAGVKSDVCCAGSRRCSLSGGAREGRASRSRAVERDICNSEDRQRWDSSTPRVLSVAPSNRTKQPRKTIRDAINLQYYCQYLESQNPSMRRMPLRAAWASNCFGSRVPKYKSPCKNRALRAPKKTPGPPNIRIWPFATQELKMLPI